MATSIAEYNLHKRVERPAKFLRKHGDILTTVGVLSLLWVHSCQSDSPPTLPAVDVGNHVVFDYQSPENSLGSTPTLPTQEKTLLHHKLQTLAGCLDAEVALRNTGLQSDLSLGQLEQIGGLCVLEFNLHGIPRSDIADIARETSRNL